MGGTHIGANIYDASTARGEIIYAFDVTAPDKPIDLECTATFTLTTSDGEQLTESDHWEIAQAKGQIFSNRTLQVPDAKRQVLGTSSIECQKVS